ncbi:MAG: Rpn family recombination-promoting nuclease/putative transposase [Roseburia sp.]|nr:Rpn family recombination-promoting nuclease/putative transposase [Roseburia sp.]
MPNTLIGYDEATGKIDYTFTNNYMFHVILQSNELVLKGLISSLLHLPFEEIMSVRIENPIELGVAINMKDFILDIRVLLNNNTTINLEMQVGNEHNWPDRSLSYLCRTYDQLCTGQEYELALPVIHIGILDFTLFPDSPEFYASYKLLNTKNHKVFNDKFILNVLSLK